MRRCFLLFLLVLLPALALAGESGDLGRARRLLDDMQYRKARRLAARVLASAASGPDEIVDAYRIRGLCLSALGRVSAALADFRRLLAIRPGFRLSDDVSPKLAAPFYQAVAINKNMQPLTLRHRPPAAREALSGLVLTVELSNPLRMIRTIRLRYWTDLDPEKHELASRVKKSGTLKLKLPAKLKARRISYYFEAQNRHGGVLARIGSADKPFEVGVAIVAPKVAAAAVEPPPKPALKLEPRPEPKPGPIVPDENQKVEVGRDHSTPWYQTWWFWTAVGVVAAGATTGAVLGSRSSGPGDGPVDYGIRFK